MANKRLDFFVVGAMKAGTTSLHYYLKSHPDVFLPVEKEVPFFAFDALYEKGMDWYLSEFFSKAREGQVLGTVSPQYMLEPRVPRRMHAECPDVKLIALLRDPIDRARSHYKMMVRAFGERRSLEDAIDGQYAGCGEYGRVLGEYLKLFSRSNLLVIYSRNLDIDPVAEVAKIFRFLGLADKPVRLPDRRLNVASDVRKKRMLRLMANLIHFHSRGIRPLIKKVLPAKYTRRLGKWSILYRSAIKDSDTIDVSLSPRKLDELARRFLADEQLLRAITGEAAPWHARLEGLLLDGASDDRVQPPAPVH